MGSGISTLDFAGAASFEELPATSFICALTKVGLAEQIFNACEDRKTSFVGTDGKRKENLRPSRLGEAAGPVGKEEESFPTAAEAVGIEDEDAI